MSRCFPNAILDVKKWTCFVICNLGGMVELDIELLMFNHMTCHCILLLMFTLDAILCGL